MVNAGAIALFLFDKIRQKKQDLTDQLGTSLSKEILLLSRRNELVEFRYDVFVNIQNN